MKNMKIMDPELEKAAVTGNSVILRHRLADCQANENYSYILSRSDNHAERMGNILHLAAWNLQVDFFKEAINDLSNHQLVEKLVCCQEWSGEYSGFNPLHVAAFVGSLEMVQAITGYYTCKYPDGSYKNLSLDSKSWLAKDSKGSTPLQIALQLQNLDCAMEILSFDSESLCDSVDNNGNSPLFLAVRKGYDEVAKQILHSAPGCIATGEDGFFTALHFAPNCSVEVCRLLIKKEVESGQNPIHKSGTPILHKWIELRKDSPLFKQLDDEKNRSFISDEIVGRYVINLISNCDHNNSNAFHISARQQNMEASTILGDFYHTHKGEDQINHLPPWLKQNKSLETPLGLALRHDSDDAYEWLKNTYGDAAFKPTEVGPLVRAVKKRKYDVAKQIGETLVQYGWRPFFPNGRKIWQVERENRTDVKVTEWLVVNFPNLIPKEEAGEALNYASKLGYAWLVESVLKEHPFALEKTPLAWIEACTKGYNNTILAFIQNCRYFREICVEQRTTPLHHINFQVYEEYRQLLENPVMKGLINLQDPEGASPLHHAIRTDNIQLAKVLLEMNDVNPILRDIDNHTPVYYLRKVNDRRKWDAMCRRYGIRARHITRYLGNIETAREFRNTLSVVAALLASITFTAGFSVPGGFNQNTGYALLGHKQDFIEFIILDTSAMLLSLITLIFLMLSVIFDHQASLLLIRLSMLLVMEALACTIGAFVDGVILVFDKKYSWVATTIGVLCCLFAFLVNAPVCVMICHRRSGVPGNDVEQGRGTTTQEDRTTTTEQTTSTEEDTSSRICKIVFRTFGVE